MAVARGGAGGGPVVVLIVAAGASWESTALAGLGAHPGIVVLKRCVDVDDLLATAASGQADAAVLGLDSHGLDVAAVDLLRHHGVRPVAVASGVVSLEAVRMRAARIGILAVVAEADLEELPEVVLAPDPAAGPGPDGVSDRAGPVDPDPSTMPAGALRPGRVVAVWGPAGAPGRSTVAAGLAALLGARGLRTTLLDADPQGGTLAQSLGVLDEISGLLAATRLVLAGDLDTRFDSVQRALDDRLTLISGLPRAERWVEVRAGTVESVIEQGRRHGHVIVDTGASLEDDPGSDFGSRPARQGLTLEALGAADEIVVVGTAEPVGLSRLARGLAELAELGTTAPVRVVVNRMRASLGWSHRDVAAMVDRFTDPASLHFLPEDRGSVDRALIEGRTLVEAAPESALAKALAPLADALLGV